MPKIVEVPGLGNVEFPDSMSIEQINSAIETDILPKIGQANAPAGRGGILPSLAEGFVTGFTDIPLGVASLFSARPEETTAGQFSQKAREITQDILGIDPTKEATTAESIAGAGGSLAGFLVPGLGAARLAKGLGAGVSAARAAGSVAGGVQGSALGASQQAQRQMQREAETGQEISDADRLASSRLGGAIGVSEIIPLRRFFGPIEAILAKVPLSKAGEVGETLKRGFARAVRSGTEEGAQEALAQTAQNLVEQGYYNPDLDVTEGLLSSAVAGGGAGATLDVILQLAAGRKGANIRTAQAQLAQSQQQEAREKGPQAVRGEAVLGLDQVRAAAPTGEIRIKLNKPTTGRTSFDIVDAQDKTVASFTNPDSAFLAAEQYEVDAPGAVTFVRPTIGQMSGVKKSEKKDEAKPEAAKPGLQIPKPSRPSLFPPLSAGTTPQAAPVAQAAPVEKPITKKGRKRIAPVETPPTQSLIVPDESSETPVPESEQTLQLQRDALKNGNRKAMLYQASDKKPVISGKNIKRVTLGDGRVVDYNPKLISAADIRASVKANRLNEVLDLGPFNKQEVLASSAAGAGRISVVERTPEGTEVKAAEGTTETAPAQVAAMDQTKLAPENQVAVEQREKGLSERLAAVASTEPGKLSATPAAPIQTPPVAPTEAPTAGEKKKRVPIEDKLYKPSVRALFKPIVTSPEGQQKLQAFEANRAAVAKALNGRLSPIMGKNARIELIDAVTGVDKKTGRSIIAEGTVSDKGDVIFLSYNIFDPSLTTDQMVDKVFDVMNHEVIHSISNSGLFRDNELQTLFNAGKRIKYRGNKFTYYDRAERMYQNVEGYTDEMIQEEAVAEMFRDARAGKLKLEGTPKGIFGRVVEFFKRLFNGFRDAKIGKIFADIESGKIGTREARAIEGGVRKFAIAAQPGSARTQRAITLKSYEKTGEYIKAEIPEAKSVLDYGAGLGIGADAMRQRQPAPVDTYELNIEKWASPTPPTFTNSDQIDKKYDSIVSLNVVNVLEPDLRAKVIKDIASRLNPGGKAIITSRAFSGDVARSKVTRPTNEEKAYWVFDKTENEWSYQRGYDGKELVDFVRSVLPAEYKVGKGPDISKTSVVITAPQADARKFSVIPQDRVNAFKALANSQRGLPESAMLDAQMSLISYPSGPALGRSLESIGDITHRMAENPENNLDRGLGIVDGKVNVGLRLLSNPVDLERINAIPDLPELKAYADEHAKLPVYNDAQRAARDAAIAFGRKDWVAAESNLRTLRSMIDNGSYVKIASSFDPQPEGGVRKFSIPAQLTGDSEQEFARWWGDGKHTLETADGTPVPVYTGTSKDKIFETFQEKDRGIWVSTNPEIASEYSLDNESMDRRSEVNITSRVIPLYARIKNPLDLSTAEKQDAFYKQYKIRVSDSPDGYKRMQAQAGRIAMVRGYDSIQWWTNIYAIFNAKDLKSTLNRFEPGTAESRKFSIPAQLTGESEQEFARWWKNSKAVNKDGSPMLVYNGTQNVFEEFDREFLGKGTGSFEDSKIGFMFTDNPRAASYFANQSTGAKGSVIPAYLSIQNPLVIDMGQARRSKSGDETTKYNLYDFFDVAEKSLNLPGLYDMYYAGEGSPGEAMLAALREQGYDGVHVINSSFGKLTDAKARRAGGQPGKWEVFIALDPSQVKSAFNKFEPGAAESRKFSVAPAPDTSEFKRWFKSSAVTDGQRNPLVVYHFGSFDEENDIPRSGMHFGTQQAAIERASGKADEDAAGRVEIYQADDGRWEFEFDGITSAELGYSEGFDLEEKARTYGRDEAIKAAQEDSYNDPTESGVTTSAYLSIQRPKRMADLGGANGEWDAAIELAKSQGYDGIVYRNQYEDKGSDSYIAFKPTQIKSTNNRGTFSETEGNIKLSVIPPYPDDTTSTVYIREAAAQPASASSVRLKTTGKVENKEIAKAFDAITAKSDITNPADYNRIVDAIVSEVEYQKQQAQSGVGWYDNDVDLVFNILSSEFPQLKDPFYGAQNRQLFTIIAGVMSNGMKARPNVTMAAMNFAHYMNTGKFSEVNPFTGKGWNQRTNIMSGQIRMLNSMMADPRFNVAPGSNMTREEKFLEWVFSDHSVRDLNNMRAKHGVKSPAKIGGVDTMRLGAYAFGPKFGPFILNLNGLTDETVDSWASRSFYRHMGRLLARDGKKTNDAPITGADREAMKRALRDIAAATNLSSRDVQAVLWFYEKALYNDLGMKIPLEVFSDGAKDYVKQYSKDKVNDATADDRTRAIARSGKEAGARNTAATPSGVAEPTAVAAEKRTALDIADAATRTGEATKAEADIANQAVKNAVRKLSIAPQNVPMPPSLADANQRIFAGTKVPTTVGERLMEVFGGLGSGDGRINLADRFRTLYVQKSGQVEKRERQAYLQGLLNISEAENAEFSAVAAIDMAARGSHYSLEIAYNGAPTIMGLDAKGNATPLSEGADPNSAYMFVDKDQQDTLFKILEKIYTGGEGGQSLIEQFQTYALAQVSKRRIAEDKDVPSDITDQYIADADALGEQFPIIKEAFESYQRYNTKLLEAVRDSGFLSQELFEEFTDEQNYYSMYRQLEEGDVVQQLSGGMASRIRFKAYEGSTSGNLMADPIVAMMHNSAFWTNVILRTIATQKSFRIGEATGVVKRLRPFEDEDGDVTIETPSAAEGYDPKVFYTYVNGKEIPFASKDPLFTIGLSGNDFVAPGLFLEMMGVPSNFLREMVTRDPGFMVANLLRDSVSTWVLAGSGANPLQTFKGFVSALKSSSSFNALRSYGIVGSFDEAQKPISKIVEGMRGKLTKVQGLPSINQALKSGWDKLGSLSEASDAATRIAVYEAAKRDGASDFTAAYRALSIMNFSRSGHSAGLRAFTKLVPFLNARIQGFDVLYKGVKAAAGVATGRQQLEFERQRGTHVLVRGMGLMAGAMALALLNDDDEDYKQLPQYIKDANILIPIPGQKGKYIQIPKPFEAGFLFMTVPTTFYDVAMGDRSMRSATKLMFNQFSSTFGFNPIPQAFLPAAENLLNRDFYTGQPLISAGMEKLDPSLQYNASTSYVARGISQLSSFLPFNYDFEEGRFVPISPIKLDNLITGYGGPIASYISMALGGATYAFGTDSQGLPVAGSELPVIRRFFIDAQDKQPQAAAEAYELYQLVDKVNRTISRLKKSGDTEALKEYREENINILRAGKQVRKMADNLNNIRAQIRRLENETTMGRQEKLDKLRELRAREIRVTRNIDQINQQLGR